jgi:hypothetical protein
MKSAQPPAPGVITPSTAQTREQNEESDNSLPGGGGSSAAAYTPDFPDSTRGTALLSPLDQPDSILSGFDPSVSYEFPDMANEQFLRFSLHVGSEEGGGPGNKPNLYQRIEQRLKEYRTEESEYQRRKKTTSSRSGPFGERSDSFGELEKKKKTTLLDNPFGSSPNF